MPPADNAAVKLQAISFCPVLPNLEVFTPDDAAVGEGEQNAFAPVVPRGSIPVQSFIKEEKEDRVSNHENMGPHLLSALFGGGLQL